MSTAVVEAKGWLEELVAREHRGRHDTWTAARDRAATKAGVERTYAKRLWDRWQSMKDVSGEAYRALRIAYETQCEKHERAADDYRARREGSRHGEAIGEGDALASLGVGALAVRPDQSGGADARA